MDNAKETKPKSFRVDNETFEKFKLLASEEFGNQGQCLAALINLYETEKSKALLVERKLEIDSFQTHINRISELFLMSLQLNEDAEERVRGEVERIMASKDQTIVDLQNQVATLTTAKDAAEKAAQEAKSQNSDLINKSMELERVMYQQKKDFSSALADKDSLNKALTDTCNERSQEIESLKATIAASAKRLERLEELETRTIEQEAEITRLLGEVEKQKDRAALDIEKALVAADKAHQQEIKEIHARHREEIKEYMSRVDQMREQHDNVVGQLRDRIQELEKAAPADTEGADSK